MPTRDEIRAVFADPKVEGMDGLYEAIGLSLKDGAYFDRAYQLVIAASGKEARAWISFCVQCSMRFEGPPEESEFLSILEEVAWKHIEKG